jgi:uncharacterized iron-regulated protein
LVIVAIGILGLAAGSVADELDLLPLGDPDRSLALASVGEGGFYACRLGNELAIDELAEALVQARVVLVGEAHTAMDQKLFHAELLAAMAELKGDLILGMEFFLRSDQDVLDRWGRGELDENGLLREVGWYDRGGYRFEYYRPIMEVARSHGIRVVGLNVSRDIPRAVNRGGLDSLDDEQRSEVGRVETSGSPQHRYLISRYFGDTVAMLPDPWFQNMFSAQCLWDVVMARSILDNLPEGATMVVIVGSGHVAYDLGIARRIREESAATGEEDLAVATFCPLIAPAPDPEGDPHGHPMGGHGQGDSPTSKPARFVRSLADYVGAFADTGGLEAYPRLGLQLDEAEDAAAVITMVWPDTPAAAAGFKHGDRIVGVDGVAPIDLSDLRARLAGLEWGQRLGVAVERGDDALEIAVLLYPEVDGSESQIAPGWEVRAVRAFDPADSAPVTDGPEPAAGTNRILVSKPDHSWVEVRTGDTLDEVHELDAEGRVQRSLYRTPQPDGTVEVVYDRDENGNVSNTVQRDRTAKTR